MHLEILFLNESQFFFYFIEVPAGSYFHECFVSVTVFAHAAQELLERGGSEPVKSGLIGFQGNTFQIVNGGYAPIESYAEDLILGDIAEYERTYPHSHGPSYHIHTLVAVENGLIKIECSVVVANHIVHPFGTVLLERGFIRCPTGKQ